METALSHVCMILTEVGNMFDLHLGTDILIKAPFKTTLSLFTFDSGILSSILRCLMEPLYYRYSASRTKIGTSNISY